ncbi:MAG: DNA double-strand break repair nuclease NurA [Anaerolineae bacterium]|nr:DNA double-strand break repair nuclease NurA [Thermoflexales bacterium]MDW8408343.1 DNA double-strand break repair nuclease NurA [Anaerolineae bacterium]
MPTDFSAVRAQIDRATERVRSAEAARRIELERLRQVFAPAFDGAMLTAACVAVAGDVSLRWNGALFNLEEGINRFIPFGEEPKRYVLLASDGSQIMPDRHRAVLFAVIQIACACIPYGIQADVSPTLTQALALADERDVRILAEDELIRPGADEILSSGEIALERDLREIEVLAERCERFWRAGAPVIALADGSLVPFALLNDGRLRPGDARLSRLITALDRLRESKAIVAGYIARPSSDALVQTCRLAGVQETDAPAFIRRAGNLPRALLDRHVLEAVLPFGHRTACFTPTWTLNGPDYLGRAHHTMRAFYLNVGRGRPEIARVELPEWCADPASLNTLTGTLGRHCRMGGGYPFILKAAHERAVLTRQDQHEIERRLHSELQRQGMFAIPSSKQEAKEKR